MGLPLRQALGLLLCGYGVLVAFGVIAHEASWIGLVALAGGLLLLAFVPADPAARSLDGSRARTVAVLGTLLGVAVLGYNALLASTFSGPEWLLLAYAAALLAAAPNLERRLGRTTVGTLVGWSFPLVLAPLALYAANAAISAGTGARAAAPFIELLIVQPVAAALRATGLAVASTGSTLLVPTGRGMLSLGVGLVCAGIYPMVLFAGILALHAWSERTPWRRTLRLLGIGLCGLWLVNLLRLVLLTRVGVHWGAEALQQAHANLGWILFAVYMAVFWPLAVRRRPSAA